MRGGVTYFSPSVQMAAANPVQMAAAMTALNHPVGGVGPAATVQKRVKAAIPIVDPNNGAAPESLEAAAAAAGLSKQGSTEDSDNSSSSKNSSSVHAAAMSGHDRGAN